MPWTFAHPAAILPLRRRLPLAALVVGSISPDIGYYLGLYPLATFAHSGLGLLMACLPMGAAALVVWHLLPVFEAGGRTFRLFNLLQHGSTVLGLAALIGVHAAWLRRQRRRPVGPTLGVEMRRWAVLGVCAVAAAATSVSLARNAGFAGEALVFRSAIGATDAFVLLIAAIALLRRAAPWLPGVPFIQLRDGAIHDRWLLQRRSMRLDELQKIEYAYHAVVGFVAVWIFTARDGREIVVSPQRPGLSRLLAELESQLPGFSREHWRREFEAGDVEDTLVIWTAPESAASDDHDQRVGSHFTNRPR